MKIDMAVLEAQERAGKNTPPIPLVRIKPRKVTKEEQITFSLRAVPTKSKSPTYALSIPYFDTGSCEEWLLTKQHIEQACKGQNLTEAPDQYTLARRILRSDALAAFNNKAKELTDETLDNFVLCLQAVTEHVFPEKALKAQKKYILNAVTKPAKMTIRRFVARIVEIAGYLREFPPFEKGQKIGNKRILGMLETAVPQYWRQEMKHFDFDPIESTLSGFVRFCERFEDDDYVAETSPKKGGGDRSKGNTKRRHGGDAEEDGVPRKRSRTPMCPIHGRDSHPMKKCRLLNDYISDKKKSYGSRDDSRKSTKSSSKKEDWKAARDQKRKREKEEMHAMIQQAVQTTVEKAVKKVRDELAVQEAEEQLDNMTLKEFNYDIPDDVSRVSSGVTMGTVQGAPKEKQD